ncbi:alkaline phosphatase [Lacrimispora sp. NSJ-141]|uniref:Alkaline phosphatase n=1 Tax=Lientehia hominis TaxID=2897778 RepID=A0AAP2RKU9_9FIRM|nr:alkaline phosphatase [Lientehia hominis]MCD2493398.1 alkaline phosphatase [Lientehia hominis]
MKKRLTKIAAVTMAVGMAMASLAGCGSSDAAASDTTKTVQAAAGNSAETADIQEQQAETRIPKYIFLFIGDGMSYPQIQSAAYYMGTTGSSGGVETDELSFMDFPVAGSAQTFDSTSFCPDSASTATSIATGNKTYSGVINMDTSLTVPYETMAEKLKEQMGYKIGILSTVNLNHATPAAFYAHQDSRNNYYEIGRELIDSGFDYFAGGALLKDTGADKDEISIYDLAEEAGYKVIKTEAEAQALTGEDGKAIIIAEQLADADSMNYQVDVKDDQMVLADYVEKGIEVLSNDNGFFMMVEGGKIDWACHANDAGSSIGDVTALDAAVEKALDFYTEHPDETLILVTGDHETGGLTIGFAGTNYDTYMTNLSNQKISYARFDEEYVAKYKEEKTDFDTVLGDVKELFGLMKADDPDASEDSALLLTDYELQRLETAYNRTLEVGAAKQDEMSQEEYVLYGTYEPFSVTITHILNNKSGIAFTSYSHTGLPVPVFAQGAGSELFEGYYDNTDIYNKIASLTGIE